MEKGAEWNGVVGDPLAIQYLTYGTILSNIYTNSTILFSRL